MIPSIDPERVGDELRVLCDTRIILVDVLNGYATSQATGREDYTPTGKAYLASLRMLLNNYGVIPWMIQWSPMGHFVLTMGSDSELLRVARGRDVTVDDDGTRWRTRHERTANGVRYVLLGPWQAPDPMPDWSGRGFG